MARILVLGGGFGGISTAFELRRSLGDEHEIVLVDRSPTFVMGLRKLWALVGVGRIADGRRDLSLLERLGIRYEQREITAIDPAARSAVTEAGVLSADYLVVALGAEARPDLVPGLVEHGYNPWSVQGVPGLKAALNSFYGGDIVIAIAGMPYTCPPAPFECAMLLDHYLRERGRRDRSSITVTTPKHILLPNAGAEGSSWLGRQLTARGIRHETGQEVRQVSAGHIDYANVGRDFDVLIGVPPHRPPAVIAESGLAGAGGWIAVDPGTFETGYLDVFAIGDVTKVVLANGLPLPKAGAIADLEGQRVAATIGARIRGESPPEPFDGRGYCFLEMGKSTAAYIEGDFYARPEPQVSIEGESEKNAERKHQFEKELLERWFGV